MTCIGCSARPPEPPLRLDDRFTHLVRVGESIVLLGDDDTRLLDAPPTVDLVRRIDGRRTAVEIASLLANRHRPEVVHYALLQLEDAGIVRADRGDASGAGGAVEDRPESTETPEGPAGKLAQRLEAAWSGRGDTSVSRVTLRGLDDGDADVLLTDDYLCPALTSSCGKRGDEDGPALLARLGSARIWIGPLIGPGQAGACLECLQARLRLNLTGRALLHAPGDADPDRFRVEALPRLIPEGAYLRMATELLTTLEKSRDGRLPAELRIVPLDGSDHESHPAPRLPHCERCGDPSLGPPGVAIRLRFRPALGRLTGGWRTVDPRATLRRYRSLISQLTGVVRRIEKVPVEESGFVHIYTASHVHHYGAPTLRAVRADRRDQSGGKGLTDVEARVSALCESLERCSGAHRGREPLQTARFSELGDDAVPPNALMNYSDRQFEERDAWNAEEAGGFQWIPEPYRDEPIAWSPMRSLVTGDVRLLPSAFLYLGFTGEGRRFCKADSNGLAGGNCVEEAILQAFLELVERDAVALWWYNQARRPGVDLETFDDPRLERICAFYDDLGRDLWALDLTTDLGIPCFAALSADRKGEHEDIVFGFGAHVEPRIAMARAVTEVNQMLVTALRPPDERRRRLLPEFRDALDWWESATLDRYPYLRPSDREPPVPLGDLPRRGAVDLREELRSLVERAASMGYDVLVHDLTRPDIRFPVVRVVVPGLRHFWRRLGPGRLYDVPAALGWTDGPLTEDRMNPVSMFV